MPCINREACLTMEAMTPDDLLKFFGTKAEIARALGIKLTSVCEWFDNDFIPELRQYQVELVSKGRLRSDKPADRRSTKKRAA